MRLRRSVRARGRFQVSRFRSGASTGRAADRPAPNRAGDSAIDNVLRPMDANTRNGRNRVVPMPHRLCDLWVLVLSGTSKCGTPPIASKAWTWASIQSGSACVQLACANVKLDAPSTATKTCALRISPVSRSMTTGTPSPAQSTAGKGLRGHHRLRAAFLYAASVMLLVRRIARAS